MVWAANLYWLVEPRWRPWVRVVFRGGGAAVPAGEMDQGLSSLDVEYSNDEFYESWYEGRLDLLAGGERDRPLGVSHGIDVLGLDVSWERSATKVSNKACIEVVVDSNLSSLVLSEWVAGTVFPASSGTTVGNISGYH